MLGFRIPDSSRSWILLGGATSARQQAEARLDEATRIVLAVEADPGADYQASGVPIRGDVLNLFAELQRDLGATLVLVTHDATLAGRMGLHIALERGRIVAAQP